MNISVDRINNSPTFCIGELKKIYLIKKPCTVWPLVEYSPDLFHAHLVIDNIIWYNLWVWNKICMTFLQPNRESIENFRLKQKENFYPLNLHAGCSNNKTSNACLCVFLLLNSVLKAMFLYFYKTNSSSGFTCNRGTISSVAWF